MTTCPTCTAEVADDRQLCPNCETHYQRLIADIPDHLRVLTMLATKTATIGPKEHGTSQAFPPMPINETALNLADETKQWLQTADSDIKAQRGLKGPEHWVWHWNNLVCDLNDLLTHPHAADRYQQLQQTNRRTRNLLNPTTPQCAGTCPTCGHTIYTHNNQTATTCPHCGNITNTDTSRAHALATLKTMHITRTPAGAAQWIKDTTGITINRKDVDNWRRRGKLHAEPQGEGYYSFTIGDLTQLANEKQKHTRQ